MSAPAWQVRQAQQQRFVEELLREIYDAAEKSMLGDRFLQKIGVTILQQAMSGRREICQGHDSIEPVLGVIREKINSFARVESEFGYLYYLLFNQLFGSLAALAVRDYTRDGFERELEVFGARRTEEVDLNQ